MVTPRNNAKKRGKSEPRSFYLKEWRKFMGVKVQPCADAIDVERQSYHRLEKNWWTLSTGEVDKLATVIGVEPDQFWFPPPKPGQERISLDKIIGEMPENMQEAAILAVRGIAGR